MEFHQDRGVLWAFDEATGTLEIAKADGCNGVMPNYAGRESYTEDVFVEEYEGPIDYDYLGPVFGTVPAHTESVTNTRIVYTQPWKEVQDQIVRVKIQTGITSIGEYSFYKHASLREVEFPDSVTKISRYAFTECTNLVRLYIPGSVKEIDWNAFDGCTSLKEAILSEGVTKIKGFAFCGCESLESVVIPDSVDDIDFCAFTDCPRLRTVEIPNTLKLEKTRILLGKYEAFDRGTKVIRRKQ